MLYHIWLRVCMNKNMTKERYGWTDQNLESSRLTYIMTIAMHHDVCEIMMHSNSHDAFPHGILFLLFPISCSFIPSSFFIFVYFSFRTCTMSLFIYSLTGAITSENQLLNRFLTGNSAWVGYILLCICLSEVYVGRIPSNCISILSDDQTCSPGVVSDIPSREESRYMKPVGRDPPSSPPSPALVLDSIELMMPALMVMPPSLLFLPWSTSDTTLLTLPWMNELCLDGITFWMMGGTLPSMDRRNSYTTEAMMR